MDLVLIIIFLLIIFGGLGGYHLYGAGGPSAGIGLLPIVLLVLVLLIIFGGGFGYYHRYW